MDMPTDVQILLVSPLYYLLWIPENCGFHGTIGAMDSMKCMDYMVAMDCIDPVDTMDSRDSTQSVRRRNEKLLHS